MLMALALVLSYVESLIPFAVGIPGVKPVSYTHLDVYKRQAVLGGVFAIIIVKCMFGGLGQNFMNPALGGRCFLLIAFRCV